MLSKTSLGMIAAAILGVATFAAPATAEGEHDSPTPTRQEWSFSGVLGRFDQAQLQRGFQVYKEVCSACHGLNLVAFRTLGDPGGPGFSEEQVKALAAEYQIKDGPNDAGKMFNRPGRPSDRFPWNFANEQEARVANSGGLPPDMSVLAKARAYHRGFPTFLFDALPGASYQEHGVDYIVALMHGYKDAAPEGQKLEGSQSWNIYFPGNKILMPNPLSDGQVAYTDGTPGTVDNYAKDVAAFLMWAAEPQLDQRKKTGMQVVVVLAVLAGLLLASKRRLFSKVAH
jgi:ubiquinol-cytochrome c reductase cytochrome c1 subunit